MVRLQITLTLAIALLLSREKNKAPFVDHLFTLTFAKHTFDENSHPMDMKYQYNAALKSSNSWLEVARPARQETAVIRPVQVRGREWMRLVPLNNMYATHPLTKDVKTWDTAWFGQYE